ncbi:cytochrome c oxidase subunit 3 [Geminicoccaceae bacterium 1502E]|nr:cytochrome c oxidase subunit 3 [Geminicoccaceae bacterium 1502E]
MGLFQQLAEKPWLPSPLPLADAPATRLPAARLGLRVFCGVVTVLFFLLLVAYAERMAYEEWRPSAQPWLMWLNTALLLTASAGMQWAVAGIREERIEAVRSGLAGGGLFAVAFLAGQLVAWRQLALMTPFDITNASIAFFYLITALHGLHLLGGLVALGWTATRLKGDPPPAGLRLNVELCAVYWHFLLVVWLVLFGLLFSGTDNLEILLALCGVR